jgi:hypothetical protein
MARVKLAAALLASLALGAAAVPFASAGTPATIEGSSQVCPPGPATATFLVFLKCRESEWRRVMPSGQTARVARNRKEEISGPSARRLVAELAGAPDSSIEIAYGMIAHSSSTSPAAMLTPAGDGFALSRRVKDTAIKIRLCALHANAPLSSAWESTVRGRDDVVLRVDLDGERYVVVMRPTLIEMDSSTPPKMSEAFRAKRDAFGASLADSRVTPTIHASEPPPPVAEMLKISP